MRWGMAAPMFYVADKSRYILKAGKGEENKQVIYLNLLHDKNNLANVMNEKTKQMKMNPKPEKTKLIHDWKEKLFSRLNVINAKNKLQTSKSNIMQEDDDCCSKGGGGGGGGSAVDQNDSTVLLSIEPFGGKRIENITYCRLCSDITTHCHYPHKYCYPNHCYHII